jgi:hypothetical protein
LRALVDDATNEVARFDAELGSEIAPFRAALLRSESTSSSQIENLTASARAIAEAEPNPFGSNDASLIVANTRAMTAAVELADRIDADSILRMHEALLSASRPHAAGRWRQQQVWTGGPATAHMKLGSFHRSGNAYPTRSMTSWPSSTETTSLCLPTQR